MPETFLHVVPNLGKTLNSTSFQMTSFIGFINSANVRDDLPGTAGTSGAAKPSTQSDCGGGLGRSLG